MHLIFGLRGLINQINQFEMFMQTQMFKWKRINLKTGKEETILVQGGLRRLPLGLYEYIFPEECLEEVLSMLNISNEKDDFRSLGDIKTGILRKVIGKGVKKIPNYERIETNRYIEMRGVVLYPIGIKKDRRDDFHGYNQEML